MIHEMEMELDGENIVECKQWISGVVLCMKLFATQLTKKNHKEQNVVSMKIFARLLIIISSQRAECSVYKNIFAAAHHNFLTKSRM